MGAYRPPKAGHRVVNNEKYMQLKKKLGPTVMSDLNEKIKGEWNERRREKGDYYSCSQNNNRR